MGLAAAWVVGFLQTSLGADVDGPELGGGLWALGATLGMLAPPPGSPPDSSYADMLLAPQAWGHK